MNNNEQSAFIDEENEFREDEFILTGKQNALFQELNKIDNRLGRMYFGALHALNSNNPDKYSIAAHNIRELIDKLPRFLNSPLVKYDLNSRVKQFEKEWAKVLKSKSWPMKPEWEGVINDPLMKYLKESQNFFMLFNINRPSRITQLFKFIKLLDPLFEKLPKKIVKNRIEEIKFYWDYFVKIAHHEDIYDLDNYYLYLDSFELFLLDKLKPRTFEKLDKIDKLIAEGEQRG